MRGLTPTERACLESSARPGVTDIEETGLDPTLEVHDDLTIRGLLVHEVRIDDDGEPAEFWHITEMGRLALRVCLPEAAR